MLRSGCAGCFSRLSLFRCLYFDLLGNVFLAAVLLYKSLDLSVVSHLGHSKVECDQVCTSEHIVKVKLVLNVE